MKTSKSLLTVGFMLILPISLVGSGLSAEDVAKIKHVHQEYEEAWLKGDSSAVLALFTDDCILLPPHGDKPRIGHDGLREFWFPPNAPPTQITKLVVTPQGTSVVTSKPAMRGRFKTGHRQVLGTLDVVPGHRLFNQV
jgi:uncharacterized protein (TIGR02246 family)